MDMKHLELLCVRCAAIAQGIDPRIIRVTMYNGKSDPPQAPPPPNPSDQIVAQAKAQPSTYTPFGNIVYSGDPTVAGSYRADVTLSDAEKEKQKNKDDIARALAERGKEGLSAIPSGFTFDGAKDPTTNRFFENQRQLLDRTFDRDEERLTQQLANQGIPMGSDAYNTEVENFRRSKDDALKRASADALGQGYSQAIGTRQQNLNEVAQALGGQQLTPVGSSAPSIDTANAYAAQQAGLNRQYQGQMAGYNADVAGTNAGIGAAASIAAAFI